MRFYSALPVTVTVLNGNNESFEVMDSTYEIQTGDVREAGFIMPDNCPSEEAFWCEDIDTNSAGTVYTITEPGTYGVNMYLGDDKYYYVAIIIDGERTKDAPNFTKAYYFDRQENASVSTAPQPEDGLNSRLISVTNLVGYAGNIMAENQNTGEIGELPVYSCLAPAEVTALIELEGLQLWEMGEKDGIYYPWQPYAADYESSEAFYERYEKGTPAGTKYTVTNRESLFYLYASDGAEDVNAVLRIDGAAPIDINSGTTSQSITFWDEIPNGSVTINGVYDITYDEYGDEIYVIDRNSTIVFNSYLSDYIHTYEEGAEESTPMLEGTICTPVVYNTVSYMDNIMWYDENGEMEMKTQVAPGMTVKFNKVGHHWIYFTPGYASRDERVSIQFNENSNLGWQWSPTISVWVIDPAPQAIYTTSKVIVDGKQIEFEAYNINGNNYFKLRDIAMAVNGTSKQFAVYWDGEKNAISLLTGAPYAPVGGELAKGDGTSKSSVMSTSAIYQNNQIVSLGAYNINGNNYFKLRDLGEAFDFDVNWDGANNCIVIDTANGYTPD